MKKKLLIIVLIVVFCLAFFWWFFSPSCVPPKKPENVPSSAVWKGGCDGGNWIELVYIKKGKIRFRIYRDWNGDLVLDANFKYQSCNNFRLTEFNWEEKIVGYLNESINIKQNSCYLVPVYPAYGGEQWIIIREKRKE